MISMSDSREGCTGSEIIVDHLIKEGVPCIAGIPGHGNLALVDAIYKRKGEIQFIQVKQEMSAVHLAEGYYRVSGVPLAVITSIGPGAANTVIGIASAYADSKPVLVFTGDTHVHMRGKGVLQEIERGADSSLNAIFDPVVKRSWNVAQARQLPSVMHRAFNYMLTGRKGPVHVNLPFDVQSDEVSCEIPFPAQEKTSSPLVYPEPAKIHAAVELLAGATRPVILIGGGVIEAGAFDGLKKVAELLGAAVINTMMGISAFPANHPLYAWCGGSKGTTVGNNLARKADVILALGTRFADESTSSYKEGVTYSIPPTKLVHVDIDGHEIGKNYHPSVGIIGDITPTLEAIADGLEQRGFKVDFKESEYFKEIQSEREAWLQSLNNFVDMNKNPPMISAVLRKVRKVFNENTYIVTSSGNVQAQVLQEFPFTVPRTCITTGGFSTMGFSLPAAIGAKLASPENHVVALVGDGDFMMTMAELSTAVQLGTDIITVILNNKSWMAIRDLQVAAYGPTRALGTDFTDHDGKLYTPDFAGIARGFGCHGERVSRVADIEPALRRAIDAGKPAVVEIMVNREYPYSGSPAVGWWDVPIPAYFEKKRDQYEQEMKGERL
ncbi:thiamine pyrophosphate-binding protein [Candidatus Bathyarchaeota archaeon]|nr:thiamine pyrophosphate-binding protein [Candidatus Bathyarchaeota archaeon]